MGLPLILNGLLIINFCFLHHFFPPWCQTCFLTASLKRLHELLALLLAWGTLYGQIPEHGILTFKEITPDSETDQYPPSNRRAVID